MDFFQLLPGYIFVLLRFGILFVAKTFSRLFRERAHEHWKKLFVHQQYEQ